MKSFAQYPMGLGSQLVLLPFFVLQGLHAVTKFLPLVAPPLEYGCT